MIMAVLIEAITVVVRKETINEKYPGGLTQYIQDCPNRTLCMDKDIVRVGFMTSEDAKEFVNNLEDLGFTLFTDGHFDEIALVDQFEGFALPCEWLDFTNSAGGKGIRRISACKIKGAPADTVSIPAGWDYETSLSKRTSVFNPNDIDNNMIFLRHEDGVDFYLDAITGEERWVRRTAKRNFNS
jgi:hypothetical protein